MHRGHRPQEVGSVQDHEPKPSPRPNWACRGCGQAPEVSRGPSGHHSRQDSVMSMAALAGQGSRPSFYPGNLSSASGHRTGVPGAVETRSTARPRLATSVSASLAHSWHQKQPACSGIPCWSRNGQPSWGGSGGGPVDLERPPPPAPIATPWWSLQDILNITIM